MRDSLKRVNSAKDSLINSTMYYRQALLQVGCEDVNREIATEIGKALMITKEQIDFIGESKRVSAIETIENISVLLEYMASKKSIDNNNISLILNGLNNLKKLMKYEK